MREARRGGGARSGGGVTDKVPQRSGAGVSCERLFFLGTLESGVWTVSFLSGAGGALRRRPAPAASKETFLTAAGAGVGIRNSEGMIVNQIFPNDFLRSF